MRELPPDLSRLGDALEQAVTRAIARRRAQLRAARALSAVVLAVPMALVAANLYVGTAQPPVAALAGAAPAQDAADRAVHPGPERGDRVPAGFAMRGRAGHAPSALHPLDLVPPPVGARATRGYDPGVASERVDRRPPFPLRPL